MKTNENLFATFQLFCAQLNSSRVFRLHNEIRLKFFFFLFFYAPQHETLKHLCESEKVQRESDKISVSPLKTVEKIFHEKFHPSKALKDLPTALASRNERKERKSWKINGASKSQHIKSATSAACTYGQGWTTFFGF